MSGPHRPGDLFELHHVMFSKIDDSGAVVLGIGDADAADAQDERVALMQTPGIVSIPTVGSEALSLNTSTGYITIASRDIRTGKIAGQMKAGETTIYAPGSQACTLYKLDGSVTQFATHDNTENGRSVYAMVAPTGFTWFMPWGKATFDERGFHVVHASGARIDLGAISGLPGPLSTMGAYVSISAPIVRVEGSTISLGTSAGVPEPAAKATTLLALLTSLQAEHAAMFDLATAIAATPAAIGTAPAINPAVITAFTALSAAMSSTAGLLSAAVLALPSASTSVT